MNQKGVIEERAILVGVILNDQKVHKVNENLDELEMLAATAGATVVGKVTQKIMKVNPSTFIEKEKLNN